MWKATKPRIHAMNRITASVNNIGHLIAGGFGNKLDSAPKADVAELRRCKQRNPEHVRVAGPGGSLARRPAVASRGSACQYWCSAMRGDTQQSEFCHLASGTRRRERIHMPTSAPPARDASG